MIETSQDIIVPQQISIGFERLLRYSQKNPVISYAYRIQKLELLEANILKFHSKIIDALKADFNKPAYETETSEILTCLIELRKAKKELRHWMKPKKVATPTELFGTSHYIRYEAKGVVLIISPWNYPVNLSLIPLIAAWSAGNRIVLKPSEIAEHSAKIIEEIVCNTFSENEVLVIQGDADIAKELVKLPFNHIFFTGSAHTAKKVLKAASENLTPVTLELGGKSPVFIDDTISLASIVKDIVFAKCLNAGQTCLAPDYILIPESKQNEFVIEWNKAITDFYGDDILSNAHYSGIIHLKQYLRIMDIIQKSLDEGAILNEPIQRDPGTKKIKPVLLLNSDWSHTSMLEEIFGPVLPIIPYNDIDKVILKLQSLSRPLSMCIFSNNKKWIQYIMDNVRSGGLSINNCLLNFCNFNLPFGGDHQSGHGAYHGRFGYETFSHQRGVSKQGKLLNPLRFFYPPYNNYKIKIKNIALKLMGKI